MECQNYLLFVKTLVEHLKAIFLYNFIVLAMICFPVFNHKPMFSVENIILKVLYLKVSKIPKARNVMLSGNSVQQEVEPSTGTCL